MELDAVLPELLEAEAFIPALFGLSAAVCGALCGLFVRLWGAGAPPRRFAALVAGNVSLSLALVLLLAALGELYYRLGYDQSDSFAMTLTGRRWFERHYSYNNWKLRDSIDYTREEVPGRTRIAFLGDSFTVGHGIADVEKRFANLIRRARQDWDVQVLAENGLDSADQLGLLRGAPPEYHTDHVVLIYGLNDISKTMPEFDARIRAVYAGDPSLLVERSFLLNTLYFRWKRVRNPGVLDFYSFTRSAYEDDAVWRRQQAVLRWIKAEVEGRGGRLLVVTFPFLHSLGDRYEFRRIHEQLGAFWREAGVPHLDLLEAMQRAATTPLTVNAYDAHPNERAHEVAAAAIRDFLEANVSPRRDH